MAEETSQAAVRQRWKLVAQLTRITETPMVVLSFAWLALVILEFIQPVGPLIRRLIQVLWGLFIADFFLQFTVAPRKGLYLRHHWLTALALFLPALRAFRALSLFRVLRSARGLRGLALLRVVGSSNRGMRALSRTFRRRGFGYVVATTVLVTFLGAAGMLAFENPRSVRASGYRVPPGEVVGLRSYGDALWWTGMMMTTVASEYWPKTPEGRVLAMLLALYAFTVFGYIAGTLASHFIGVDAGEQQAEERRRQAASADQAAALRRDIEALRKALETTRRPDR